MTTDVPVEPSSLERQTGPIHHLLDEIAELVLRGEAEQAVKTAGHCLESGIDPLTIILEGANKGMQIAGRLYEEREYYVPELVFTAEAMQQVVDYIKPHLLSADTPSSGTVVLGVVLGDIHSIGKNIVKTLLESRGLNVLDLGEDVAPKTFVQTALEHDADLIGMSTLMTTTLEAMEETVRLVGEHGLRSRTIIGGAPVNEPFRLRIGADAYAPNANEAVHTVEALLQATRLGLTP
jgi:methanogenic corrinoid protein MtbC1